MMLCPQKHYRIVLLRSSSLEKNETTDKLRASDLEFHSSREVSKNVRFLRFLDTSLEEWNSNKSRP
jgi:hypothetical protein